ncbi:hypothetical protein AOLI_G00049830 [Acnodon oligacanthus]
MTRKPALQLMRNPTDSHERGEAGDKGKTDGNSMITHSSHASSDQRASSSQVHEHNHFSTIVVDRHRAHCRRAELWNDARLFATNYLQLQSFLADLRGLKSFPSKSNRSQATTDTITNELL